MGHHHNVLFLCSKNSARSIMAEAILNRKGFPNFTAYSAGSFPKGKIHPEAIRQIEVAQLPTDQLRSKSLDEFARPDAPDMDLVFTLCDNTAREVCPIWPGHPITGHWSVPDPSAAAGTQKEIQKAFRDVFMGLERRISLMLSLPLQSLDTIASKTEVATKAALVRVGQE